MKYISLPAKPSANKSSVERFLKAIRSEPVYFCVVPNRCLSQMLYYLTYLKVQHRSREKIIDVRMSCHIN